MQDPALLGTKKSVLGRFGEESRMGELEALRKDLGETREIGPFDVISPPGTLEGGDIMVTDMGLFIGESKRTNSTGIQQLTKFLKNLRIAAVKTPLMHLLCGCSYLSNRTMLIAPDLLNPGLFPGFKFIEIPEGEAYAADALYLGAGRVLIPSGFQRTATKLNDAGFVPVEIDMSEFYKGDGGVTCLSSPVYSVF
jgi:dimethylargininase